MLLEIKSMKTPKKFDRKIMKGNIHIFRKCEGGGSLLVTQYVSNP